MGRGRVAGRRVPVQRATDMQQIITAPPKHLIIGIMSMQPMIWITV